MGVEIERKFTVRADFCPQGAGTEMAQGYLSRDPQRTVRVRLAGGRGYLTVKGETRGMVRAEYEYEIPPTDARAMLALCDSPLVEKTRYV
ncbi:MAG: adenylate cyclase, partial [Selenomonas sp.]|nr:adenylate cyclase [Selenomonas sp.]